MRRRKGHKKKFVLRIYPYTSLARFEFRRTIRRFSSFGIFLRHFFFFSRHDRSLSCTSDTFWFSSKGLCSVLLTVDPALLGRFDRGNTGPVSVTKKKRKYTFRVSLFFFSPDAPTSGAYADELNRRAILWMPCYLWGVQGSGWVMRAQRRKLMAHEHESIMDGQILMVSVNGRGTVV